MSEIKNIRKMDSRGIEKGCHDELMKLNSMYAEIFRMQAETYYNNFIYEGE